MEGMSMAGHRDWYLMHYSNPSVTGGQKKNTHTHFGLSTMCAISLLINLETAQQGRSVLFSDEQKLLVKE